MPILVGEKLKKRYEIKSLLGQGEHGQTWKAWDTLSNPAKWCVIKIPLGSAGAIKELEAESSAAGLLHHKNIVPVLEFLQKDGFLVEEYVPGNSLQYHLRGHAKAKTWFSKEKSLEILKQVLEGLEYAHEKSRVHGDVKPANIILPDAGEARLVDFGVSRFVSGAYVSGGAPWDPPRLGSAAYSAPEVLSTKHWSSQSDLFSAGIVAYLMFTRHHPFVDPTGLWTTDERISDPEVTPEPLKHYIEDDGIDHVVMKLINKDPKERYRSAREVLDDLFGTEVAVTACRNCGTENPPAARYCNGCGESLSDVELHDTEVERQLGVSFTLFRSGNAEEAIKISSDLLRSHPGNGKVAAHLAFMFNQTRRYEEALEAARISISATPSFSSGYRNLGFALSALGKFDESVPAFQKAFDRETRPRDRAQILYNMAYALMLGGDLERAKSTAGDALKIDPTYPKPRSLINRLKALIGTENMPEIAAGVG
jgi:serine/threonine protein kinase